MTRYPFGRPLLTALLASTALLISACESETPVVEEQAALPAQRSVETIADEYLAALLERNPTMATSYSIEGARHDRLFDNSPEASAAWQASEDAWLAELEAIGKPQRVGSRDWVTFGFLHEALAFSKTAV